MHNKFEYKPIHGGYPTPSGGIKFWLTRPHPNLFEDHKDKITEKEFYKLVERIFNDGETNSKQIP